MKCNKCKNTGRIITPVDSKMFNFSGYAAHVTVCDCEKGKEVIDKHINPLDNTWTCKECGTVHEIKPNLEMVCNYCESIKNKPSNVKISYKTLWNKFWKAINENPNEIFIKEILLDLKDDFEKMVQDD